MRETVRPSLPRPKVRRPPAQVAGVGSFASGYVFSWLGWRVLVGHGLHRVYILVGHGVLRSVAGLCGIRHGLQAR